MAADVTAIRKQFEGQLKRLGKAGMSALFPKDFNYYSIALELVDGRGRTVDYFLFPINPDDISETNREITRVRKTITGVSTLKNPTFNPVLISIQGDFGKRFKIILNGGPIEFAGISISRGQNLVDAFVGSVKKLATAVPQFSTFAKTGYGCIKVLESIKEKSKQIDPLNGRPYSLYLYNSITGNNYMVEFVEFRHNQNVSRNMIPRYSMQLIAVAPLDSLLARVTNLKSLLKNITISFLQKRSTAIANNIRKLIKKK